jgi:hypothetical protein
VKKFKRWPIALKSWTIVGVLASTTSCVQYSVGMIFNESSDAIELSFAIEPTPVGTDNLPRCGLSSNLPTQRLGVPSRGGPGPAADWAPVEVMTLSADECAITFVLAARSAAKVFENSFCDDHTKVRDQIERLAYRPYFSYVTIKSAHINKRWDGWAASEQFRKNSRGHCVLVWK